MSKAKEMFEALGYKIKHKDNKQILYTNHQTDKTIRFFVDSIQGEFTMYNDTNFEVIVINKNEHKAIAQQMEELGWIK